MRQTTMRSLAIAALLALALPAGAQDATYTVRMLAPETALAAAQAALKKCRDSGWQVAVAVVDRAGVAQGMLGDRYAGAHTFRTAIGKAWTAASFRTPTTELARISQPGQPQSGIRNLPNAVLLGGGLLIEAQGSILGAIGVSGAPGGDADDTCARAGSDAIRAKIEF